MRTLYFDCSMGAAGDMLSACLYELLPNKEAFLEELHSIGLPSVRYIPEPSTKCGILGTHFSVKVNGLEEGEDLHTRSHGHCHSHHSDHCHDHDHSHEHEHDHSHSHSHDHGHDHSHNTLEAITHRISHLNIPEEVRRNILSVYNILAEAESHVHGVSIANIHFHEVGTLDALADIAAVCLLIHKLRPDRILASPIHVGSGQVHCAHGILPVPAPATARILRDIPIYSGSVKGELCTPTGAALLKHFVTEFTSLPPLRLQAIGYGMGKKDFPAANCIRSFLGDSFSVPNRELPSMKEATISHLGHKETFSAEAESNTEEIIELQCNLDDMTPEQIGFATEVLLSAGAPDVYTTPIYMKKNRPGTLLSVLCKPEQKQAMLELLFLHTGTLGIREQSFRRYTLHRRIRTVQTPYGPVRLKTSHGYNTQTQKYEYEDLAHIARTHNIPLKTISLPTPEEGDPSKE